MNKYIQAVSIMYCALKDIGALFDLGDNLPYRKEAERLVAEAFRPLPLSIRK